VKLQNAAYLEKARALLEQAETMLRVNVNDAAGRTAYLAGFHAAQALIFERDDRVVKTHRGVQGEFSRLIKDDPQSGVDLRSFLGRTYNLKAVADYETGPGSKVSRAQAEGAIAGALHFVDAIEKAIGS